MLYFIMLLKIEKIQETIILIIPWQTLDSNTLQNIIEYFVLRDGTDYGQHEKSLAQKVADVRRQLEQGHAVLVWSELHETMNIQQNPVISAY